MTFFFLGGIGFLIIFLGAFFFFAIIGRAPPPPPAPAAAADDDDDDDDPPATGIGALRSCIAIVATSEAAGSLSPWSPKEPLLLHSASLLARASVAVSRASLSMAE